jgi:hypothetical protein
MKQDGVDECAEVQPTRERVKILKEKWPVEDSYGSVQYWQIKDKQLLALEKETTYSVTPHSRRIVGTAVIAATNGCGGSRQAPGTTMFLGEQLEIVHVKPQWITMKQGTAAAGGVDVGAQGGALAGTCAAATLSTRAARRLD